MPPAVTHRIRPAQRAFAGLCVGLVLVLGLFGANADLHALLHAAEHGPEAGEHHEAAASCAVDLLAAGVVVPLEVPVAVAAPVAPDAGRVARPVLVWWAEPDHRLRPGRGPPRG